MQNHDDHEPDESTDQSDQLDEKKFACDVSGCSKSYSKSGKLNRHKLSHAFDHPHTCEIPGCGRKFARKDHLKAHEKTHQQKLQKEAGGEKLFKCDVCWKSQSSIDD